MAANQTISGHMIGVTGFGIAAHASCCESDRACPSDLGANLSSSPQLGKSGGAQIRVAAES